MDKILNEDIELDSLLDEIILKESIFKKELTEDQDKVLNEIYEEICNSLKTDKKYVTIKDDEITIKGTNLFNRLSAVKMNDVVEGMILRKYYESKPKVHITVTYFKIGGKISYDFVNKKNKNNPKVDYSLGAGITITTSIKIKVKKADNFKVGRVVKNLNNRDASYAYEKLSEENITESLD